jgi:MFS family permease
VGGEYRSSLLHRHREHGQQKEQGRNQNRAGSHRRRASSKRRRRGLRRSPLIESSLAGAGEIPCAFAAGNAVVGLQNLAMYALLFQLPIFFEQVRGIHSGTTGRSLIGMMIAMAVCAPLGGRLAERLGARLVALVGCLAAAVSCEIALALATLAAQLLPGRLRALSAASAPIPAP